MQKNPLSDGRRVLIIDRLSKVSLSNEQIQTLIQLISAADPTHNGSYSLWLANLVAIQNIRLPEDSEKITKILKDYDALKNKNILIPDDRNIFKYKSLADLQKQLVIYQAVPPAPKPTAPITEQVTWKSGPWSLIEITDPNILVKHSRQTSWCTSVLRYAELYVTTGRVFLILRNKKKYALGYVTNYDPIYKQYLEDMRKIHGMLLAGQDPISGETFELQERPELRDLFPKPLLELLPMKDTDSWYEWKELLQYTSSAVDYYEYRTSKVTDITRSPTINLPSPELQLKNTQDEDLPPKIDRLLRSILIKFVSINAQSSVWALRDYYRHLSSTRNPKLEKALLQLADPTKLVDYVQGTMPGRKELLRFSDFALLPLGHAPRWKRAEPLIMVSFPEFQRYYELLQHSLTPKEQEEFQTHLAQGRTQNEGISAWPEDHHLIPYYRLSTEDSLNAMDLDRKDLEELLKSPRKWDVFSNQTDRENALRTVRLRNLKEMSKDRSKIFKELREKITSTRKLWNNFREQTLEILDGEFTARRLIQIIHLYKKLFSKEESAFTDLWQLGTRTGRWYPRIDGPQFSEIYSFKEEVYPFFSHRPTLELVIDYLINTYTPFGMVLYQNTYMTATTFLKVILKLIPRLRKTATGEWTKDREISRENKLKKRTQNRHLDALAAYVQKQYGSI